MHPAALLLIDGSGLETPYVDGMKRQLHTAGVAHQVVWQPHVPHERLPNIFSASDIAVWPRQETMTALQAAACACPIILQASTVGKEWTADGAGCVFDHADGLIDALDELIAHPDLRSQVGARGAAMVRRRHDWAAISRAFNSFAGVPA